MNTQLRPLAALVGLLFVIAAQAHGPAVSRYRVNELPFPDSLRAGCVPDYHIGASIQDINDFGVVNGNFNCITQADPATSTFQQRSAAFVAATWFGAVELPRPADPGFSFGSAMNNRGEIFGFEIEGNIMSATRWTLFGGHERLFFDPACDFIQSASASDGNGRYIVGGGLRPDSRLPPPVDTFCLRQVWLIRSTDGVESIGPLDGSPAAINAFNVAVGSSDRSAISYHVPTAQVRVLHAADATHSAEATDINDLGQVVGRVFENVIPPVPNTCNAIGVAVRWERDGSESALPHLPGAVSSHAFGAGYDGETVGDSGPGTGCADSNRATLWKQGRAFDLNTLIPRSARITLTHALSINRGGQISAGGYDNDEPLTQCPRVEFVDGAPVFKVVPCHNQRMYVLTPLGR
jgi:hypothetical protein